MQDEIITDDVMRRLTTFPNVIITGHQAFFTRKALAIIAQTTINSISDSEAGRSNGNSLKSEEVIWPTGKEKTP